MSDIPQLYMRHPDITKLPPLCLPSGFCLYNHTEGVDEPIWEALVKRAFNNTFSFEACIVNGGFYKPERVLYLKYNGKTIATATAVERSDFPGEGWFRMIATDPDSRGLGAGRLICLAALHSLAARGYKTAALSTDDDRIPALCLYLSLGFEPIYTHESHKERWEKVMNEISKIKKGL